MKRLKNTIVRLLGFGLILLVLGLEPSAPARTAGFALANSVWPMYQHDPQHTGLSPLLGPQKQPKRLWSVQLPVRNNEGGLAIASDGSLVVSLGGSLSRVDPVKRELSWSINQLWGNSSTPMLDENNLIYWGYGEPGTYFGVIGSFNLKGKQIWSVPLDTNGVFRSSPNLGPDGHLYFVHDALWSFTRPGGLRWFIPYGELGSHASPAVGYDGRIYNTGVLEGKNGTIYGDICAYRPEGSMDWCLDLPGNAADLTPSIGVSGTIYMPSRGTLSLVPPFVDSATLYAINPAGTVEWKYTPDLWVTYGIQDGIAIAPDGSIYFGLNTGSQTTYLYALTYRGKLKWRVAFPTNPLTGNEPYFGRPITIDRMGNAYVCLFNGRCYAISAEGQVLWEFEYPSFDSMAEGVSVGPILGADGLYYVVDGSSMLSAWADPDLVPELKSPTTFIHEQAAQGAPSFLTTLEVTSTLQPIQFTALITPGVPWLSLGQPGAAQIGGVSPEQVSLVIDPSGLAPGIYSTTLRVRPVKTVGAWLEIPVRLNIDRSQVFVPLLAKNYTGPFRIVYSSSWFGKPQLASLDQNGQDRTIMLESVAGEVPENQYSPDGKRVVTSYWNGIKYESSLFDLQTGQRLLALDDVGISQVSWAPDSSRFVYLSNRENSDGEVYILDPLTNTSTRLTRNALTETFAGWSPAGDKIVIGTQGCVIQVLNIDGTLNQTLKTGNFCDFVEGWSPDGRFLLLASRKRSLYDYPVLSVYDLQTGVSLVAADNYLDKPNWSPDGSKIAYVGWNELRYVDIFVINPDGSDRQNLTASLAKEDDQPAWSPDSQWVAFASRSELVANDQNYDLYVVKRDGSSLRQLTQNIQMDNNPFWLSRITRD